MKEHLSQNLLKMTYYVRALELFDLNWGDCDLLQKNKKSWSISYQIIRSCGFMSANIEEGYGRESTKGYLRFLRIARGSALKTQGWCFKSKHILGDDTSKARMQMLSEIIGKISGAITSVKAKIQ